jgi:hypothetical protein
MTPEFSAPSFLKLSIQRALLGNITANLAALRGTLEGNRISLFAYFFDHPTKADKECLDEAETCVIADFPSPYVIETYCGRTSEVVFNTLHWDFLRAEAITAPQNQR